MRSLMTILPEHIVQRSGAILLLRMVQKGELGLTLVYPDGTLVDAPMHKPEIWDFFIRVANITSSALTVDPHTHVGYFQGRQHACEQLMKIVPALAAHTDMAMMQVDALTVSFASIILHHSDEVEQIATVLLSNGNHGHDFLVA